MSRPQKCAERWQVGRASGQTPLAEFGTQADFCRCRPGGSAVHAGHPDRPQQANFEGPTEQTLARSGIRRA